MTFHAQSQLAGREVVRILELVVPRCALRYGNAPCTAGARAAAHPNLIQQSEVFSGGTPGWIGHRPVVFSAWVAPNSTLTGVTISDSGIAEPESVQWRVNSNDPVFAALASSAWLDWSLHVLKKPNSSAPTITCQLGMFDGVSSAAVRMQMDPFTGCFSYADIFSYNKPTRAQVMDCGSWWRMMMRVNRASANSVTVQLMPAFNPPGNLDLNYTATQQGSQGVWGIQLYAHNSASAPFAPYITRGVESQWLSTGLAQACYNTAATCQALSSYLQGDQSIFFIDEKVDLPPGLEAFPALVNVSLQPTRLNPQMGVAESARLTVELKDFPYDDAGTDPYVDARSYVPSSQGTFFGRFFARDPYIQGKRVRYYEGYYAGSGTFTFSHYIVREFIVDDFDRPDYRGRLKLRGTDILRLTNGDRSICPIPCTAALQNNLTTVDTAIFLPSSADAAYLVSDPHVRIDDELFQLVTQTGCRWTTTRGAGRTDVRTHTSGAVVQLCKTYSYMSVCSIAMDQLVNFASIPSSYIPVSSWDAEKASTLSTYNLYNIISEPTPVRENLTDIMKTCDLSIWYDEIATKISLRHQSPWAVSFLPLTDSGTFLENAMSIKARDDIKVTRVGVRYGPTNYADPTDYSRFQMAVNSTREDPRFDGRKSEQIIETGWLNSSHDALAATIAGRAMLRYSELVPLEASFVCDATVVASVRTGDVIELNTRLLQNVDGTMAPTRMQVLEHGPEKAGHSYRYTALLYQGLTAATSLSISVSTYNYNVHSALGGPATAVRVYLTVNSGIHVGGSGTDYAAITTSGLPAGSVVFLTLIGSSMVLGYAGAPGAGAVGDEFYNPIFADWQFILVTSAEQGRKGGAAFYIADGVTAYIDVGGGYLFAGGPGGGGGGCDYGPGITQGGSGGMGQGFTNSGGPNVPQTAGVVDGGSGAVWGGTAYPGVDGDTAPNPPNMAAPGGAAGPQGFAVQLASASAVYYFPNGYDASRLKGLIGL